MAGFGGFSSIFGRVSEALRTPDPMETIGGPGFRAFSGDVQNDEKDASMSSVDRFREFSDILANTAIVSASVRYFLNLLAKSGWNVEPADDSNEAQEMADLVWEILNDMQTPWRRVVRRAGMFTFHGFSIQEWTAKRREDGIIGLLDIESRPQVTIERWGLDDHGRVTGAWQRVPQSNQEVFIPREKMVYLVDDAMSDTPIGLGLFRHLVDSRRRLDAYLKVEGYAFETNLRGIPIVKAPMEELDARVAANTLTAASKERALSGFRTFIQRHFRAPSSGFLIDSATYRDKGENQTPSSVSKWSAELLKGDDQGLPDIANAINRINREMATVLGTEGLLLGSENGTQALSRDKSHTFSLRVESTQSEMAEAMDKDVVHQLFVLNGWDLKLKPYLMPDPIQYRDPAQLTQAILDLAQAGAVIDGNDPVVNVIRSVLGLPEAPEEDLAAMATKPIPPINSTLPILQE